MFWALAVILLAVGAFTSLVLARRPAGAAPIPGLDLEQIKGFVYVGTVALAALAAGVVVVGLLAADSGRAEALAVLGFLGYLLYLTAAVGVLWLSARRGQSSPGR